jgi:hypothetical protein
MDADWIGSVKKKWQQSIIANLSIELSIVNARFGSEADITQKI